MWLDTVPVAVTTEMLENNYRHRFSCTEEQKRDLSVKSLFHGDDMSEYFKYLVLSQMPPVFSVC